MVGFEKLSIGSVAEYLGVAKSTLCLYIEDRHHLVVTAVDRAFSGLEEIEDGIDWRTALETEAWARWRILRTHSGLIEELRGCARVSTVLTDRSTALVDLLYSLGFDLHGAVIAVHSVMDLVHDGATQVAIPNSLDDSDAKVQLGSYLSILPDHVTDVMKGALANPDPFFVAKLAIVLDGISASR